MRDGWLAELKPDGFRAALAEADGSEHQLVDGFRVNSADKSP